MPSEKCPSQTEAIDQPSDPAIDQFLGVLARDIDSHPERLLAIDPGLVRRLHRLTKDVEIDLDSQCPKDDS